MTPQIRESPIRIPKTVHLFIFIKILQIQFEDDIPRPHSTLNNKNNPFSTKRKLPRLWQLVLF
ncbi:MAG: hypothetical protein K0Q87_4139 [Neobacillus sp.]|nr:hypothetical protein [Neobacillus sp.]